MEQVLKVFFELLLILMKSSKAKLQENKVANFFISFRRFPRIILVFEISKKVQIKNSFDFYISEF